MEGPQRPDLQTPICGGPGRRKSAASRKFAPVAPKLAQIRALSAIVEAQISERSRPSGLLAARRPPPTSVRNGPRLTPGGVAILLPRDPAARTCARSAKAGHSRPTAVEIKRPLRCPAFVQTAGPDSVEVVVIRSKPSRTSIRPKVGLILVDVGPKLLSP